MLEPTVPVRSLPTSILLGLLVGDVAAAALARRPLSDHFIVAGNTSLLAFSERGLL